MDQTAPTPDRPVPWVEGLTIGQVLRAVAARDPDREALVFPERGYRATYAAYDRHVDEVARGLLAMGIACGDHVAIWATNWPEWVVLHLATARIGAVLVTINPAYRVRELVFALAQCDAKALFLIDRFKASDYLTMLASACPELAASMPGLLSSAQFPRLRWVVSIPTRDRPGLATWRSMLEMGRSVSDATLRASEARVDASQPINLQYTSGTTGFPKGVLLSHRNLLLNAHYVGVKQHLGPTDRVCVPVPFYHCFGCAIGTLGTLVHGATMLVPAEHFDPAKTLDCIERERATALYGVPTMFHALLDDETYPARDVRSLRTGIMAGSPCPVALMKRVVFDLGAREMTIAYGLTEASPTITQTRVDDPIELRVETVGTVIPGGEAKIVHPDTGQSLPDGTVGELWARGHNVMLGYYKLPEATRDAIDPEGWLRTGDLATRDARGYFRITGRIRDLIIRGGENIYPKEIEDVLSAHPNVDVAQVFGVPDDRFGEAVCAWVRVHPGREATAEELRALCRDRLAHFKVPRDIEFVDEFPMTVTGKFQKYRMREIQTARTQLFRARSVTVPCPFRDRSVTVPCPFRDRSVPVP